MQGEWVCCGPNPGPAKSKKAHTAYKHSKYELFYGMGTELYM